MCSRIMNFSPQSSARKQNCKGRRDIRSYRVSYAFKLILTFVIGSFATLLIDQERWYEISTKSVWLRKRTSSGRFLNMLTKRRILLTEWNCLVTWFIFQAWLHYIDLVQFLIPAVSSDISNWRNKKRGIFCGFINPSMLPRLNFQIFPST